MRIVLLWGKRGLFGKYEPKEDKKNIKEKTFSSSTFINSTARLHHSAPIGSESSSYTPIQQCRHHWTGGSRQRQRGYFYRFVCVYEVPLDMLNLSGWSKFVFIRMLRSIRLKPWMSSNLSDGNNFTGNWTQSISTYKQGWSFSNILTRRNHAEGWCSRRI